MPAEKPSVAIIIPVFTETPDGPLASLEEAGWNVLRDIDGYQSNEDQLIDLLQDQDATVAGGEPYTRRVLEECPRLKHIARWGVGFDKVDLEAAADLGVLVTTTQGANDWGVADHAFSMIAALGHGLLQNDHEVRAKRWGRPVVRDLWGATIGIVGLGRIGRGVALRANGFSMKILAHEPFPDQQFVAEHGIELVSLDELLSRADYVTLHVPGSIENKHLISTRELSLMKPTAFIVNTARGTLIDEAALLKALRDESIAGAGLDVREVEPNRDGTFDEFRNVILTSHIAGVTNGTVVAMSNMAVRSILEGWRGERPHGLLNPAAWERRRWLHGS
jgi:D-3-phosphoglycerate dehydrogenase